MRLVDLYIHCMRKPVIVTIGMKWETKPTGRKAPTRRLSMILNGTKVVENSVER
jgi:hypothetical protein